MGKCLERLYNGIIKENPTFVLILGMCPTLAVTSSLINGAGGGAKACAYGCLGLGSCVKACEFGAISVVNGKAVVDRDKCVACGKCVKACPKNLIEIITENAQYMVSCSSKDKGRDVMQACSVGCIGCGLCAKNCPNGAIEFEYNLAHIDQSKCKNCGICAEKCPKKIITKLH